MRSRDATSDYFKLHEELRYFGSTVRVNFYINVSGIHKISRRKLPLTNSFGRKLWNYLSVSYKTYLCDTLCQANCPEERERRRKREKERDGGEKRVVLASHDGKSYTKIFSTHCRRSVISCASHVNWSSSLPMVRWCDDEKRGDARGKIRETFGMDPHSRSPAPLYRYDSLRQPAS